MRRSFITASWLLVAMLCLSAQTRVGALRIYYIDTEGGQSTLFVGPSG